MSATSYFGFFEQFIAPREQVDQCDLESTLLHDGVSCSLVENYLTNIIILGCMVVIGICIEVFRKKVVAQSSNLVGWRNYSLKWSILMIYGSTYEIVAYSFINFIYMYKSGQMIAGIVLSCSLISAIVAIGIYFFRVSVKSKVNQMESYPGLSVASEHPSVTFMRLIKMSVVGIVTASLIGSQVVQPIVILVIELIYLGMLFFNRKKWRNDCMRIEMFYASAYLAVLILRAISYSSLGDEPVNQLGFVVFAILLLNVFLVTGWSFLAFWQLFSAMRASRNSQPFHLTSSKLPTEEKQDLKGELANGQQPAKVQK
jgi:hypothetical protein